MPEHLSDDELLQQAIHCHQQMDFQGALEIYQILLLRNPDHVDALLACGLLSEQLQNTQYAITCYERLSKLYPDNPEYHFKLGFCCGVVSDFENAEAHFKNVLKINPKHAETLFRLAIVYSEQGCPDLALGYIKQAIDIGGKKLDYLSAKGVILSKLLRMEDAIAVFKEAIALHPDKAFLFFNLALAYVEIDQTENALIQIDLAIELKPDNAQLWSAKGSMLSRQLRDDEAIACFEKAIHLNPSRYGDRAELIHRKLSIYNWDNLQTETTRLLAACDERLLSPADPVMPLILHLLPSTLEQQKYCSEIYGLYIKSKINKSLIFNFSRNKKSKIKIGYFSSDFRDHPLVRLIVGLLEYHDRSKFEIYVYSYGVQSSAKEKLKVANSADYFFDVSSLGDSALANKIHQDGIDILVDLTGYSWIARTQVLALRPAPIQVSYLGFLGTMGADFIDYILADSYVIPSAAGQFFSEKIVDLTVYQINDDQCSDPPAMSRAQCGLPESAFVFCCFTQPFKVMPAIFDMWCSLLHDIPNAVLWILASSQSAKNNLMQHAAARGIGAERIIFAETVSFEEHLARLPCADLFLDTFPYNAGTTASHVLWRGVPLLTCSGQTFVSRIAGSLLQAMGAPELITYSLNEYYQKAFWLASQPEKLTIIRKKLKENRASAILFDSAQLTREIEAQYQLMFDNWIKNP